MRKPKTSSKIKRKKSTIPSYDSILIVCEGAVTEPKYLNSLKSAYGISSAMVTVAGEECGSSPKSIVEYAKTESKNGFFDKVYCVFDRDKHDSYYEAISQIDSLDRSRKWPSFRAIVSTPCFEIWILLHFIYSTKDYASIPGRSICEQVISDLKVHFSSYRKGCSCIYDLISSNQQKAIANAKRLRVHIDQSGATGPTTDMDELVEKLISLQKVIIPT